MGNAGGPRCAEAHLWSHSKWHGREVCFLPRKLLHRSRTNGPRRLAKKVQPHTAAANWTNSRPVGNLRQLVVDGARHRLGVEALAGDEAHAGEAFKRRGIGSGGRVALHQLGQKREVVCRADAARPGRAPARAAGRHLQARAEGRGPGRAGRAGPLAPGDAGAWRGEPAPTGAERRPLSSGHEARSSLLFGT